MIRRFWYWLWNIKPRLPEYVYYDAIKDEIFLSILPDLHLWENYGDAITPLGEL